MSSGTAAGWTGALAAGSVAAVLAWWLGSPSEGGIALVEDRPQPERTRTVPAQSGTTAASLVSPTWALPAPAQPVPSLPPPGLATLPVTLTAPPTLQVGEQAELGVAVGTDPTVEEIGFTVRFDPNVLQARAGNRGGWAAANDPDLRFAAEVSEPADQVRIRNAAVGMRAGTAAGSVALVQFQAVAPGTTKVTLTDMTIKDRSGRTMPVLMSTSTVQVTAEPAPPPAPGARLPLAVPTTDPGENGD